MSKANEAFRTISEVATELDVPKHVLRFWEAKFPQIKPMKRGGGRRYYRPEDMELLRGIRHLLHAEGYTIKGVQKILREHGIDQVKASAAVAAVREADVPKGKRGRRALKPVETPIATSAARAAPAVSVKPEMIAQLISELELCRRLLTAETAAKGTEGAKKSSTARPR